MIAFRRGLTGLVLVALVAFLAIGDVGLAKPDVEPPSGLRDLESSDPEVRRRGAAALGALDTEAHLTVPTLVEVLDDEDAGVRAAARASKEITP